MGHDTGVLAVGAVGVGAAAVVCGACGLELAGLFSLGLCPTAAALPGGGRIVVALLATSVLGAVELCGLADALEVCGRKALIALGFTCGIAAGVAALGLLKLPGYATARGWETIAQCAAASLVTTSLACLSDLTDEDPEVRVSTLCLIVTTCVLATLIAVLPLRAGL